MQMHHNTNSPAMIQHHLKAKDEIQVTTQTSESLAMHVLRGEATTEEQLEFDRRMLEDPSFGILVDQLKTWLSPLSEEEARTNPDPHLLGKMMKQITQSDKNARSKK